MNKPDSIISVQLWWQFTRSC